MKRLAIPSLRQLQWVLGEDGTTHTQTSRIGDDSIVPID